jgi:hypothetical protein
MYSSRRRVDARSFLHFECLCAFDDIEFCFRASGARRSSATLNITAPLGRRSTISYLYARVDALNDLPA